MLPQGLLTVFPQLLTDAISLDWPKPVSFLPESLLLFLRRRSNERVKITSAKKSRLVL